MRFRNQTIRLLPAIFIALFIEAAGATQESRINLECDDYSENLIAQLSMQDLLTDGEIRKNLARQIINDSCLEATQAAQAQHETHKKKALENWFFEHQPDKPGNRRLKKTH